MLIEDPRVVQSIVFHPGMKNTYKQNQAWAGLGIHWTGAENPSRTVANTLISRGLSIHFILDTDGTLVQTASMATKCAHIGSPGNARFLGVETVCRGFATKEDWADAAKADPSLRERTQLDWDAPRDVFVDEIDGKTVRFASFTPQQIEKLVWLSETTAGMCGFPRRIPSRVVTDKDVEYELRNSPVPDIERYVVKHEGKLWMPSFDRKPSRYNSRASNFSGVLGHFHIHKTKCDPGTPIFYALWAEGWNPAEQKILGVR